MRKEDFWGIQAYNIEEVAVSVRQFTQKVVLQKVKYNQGQKGELCPPSSSSGQRKVLGLLLAEIRRTTEPGAVVLQRANVQEQPQEGVQGKERKRLKSSQGIKINK